MTYQIIRLHFSGNVHLGEGMLESAGNTFCADTLFSAICCEIAVAGGVPEELAAAAREHKLLLSDAFPFRDGTLFLPKPCVPVRSKTESDDGDSVRKKLFKKLRYIPVEDYAAYLDGRMTKERCKEITDHLSGLGQAYLAEHVSIPRDSASKDDPKPYAVGGYRFHQKSGLWFVLGTETEEITQTVLSALKTLSFSGIGGKRSSGCGRFTYTAEAAPAALLHGLETAASCPRKLSLSVCLPQNSELISAMDNASCVVVRRSGFVGSDTYADRPLKKKDLYALQAGSCFVNPFLGDVYDVSEGGSHPVWRYAVPLFFGVEGNA